MVQLPKLETLDFPWISEINSRLFPEHAETDHFFPVSAREAGPPDVPPLSCLAQVPLSTKGRGELLLAGGGRKG